MHRHLHRWMLVILFIVLVTPLMPTPALAAPAHGIRINTPHTRGGVFPPCNGSNDGEIIVVGGNQYICGCVAIVAGEPCSWVWRNLNAADSLFSTLEMDQGVDIWDGPKINLYFQPDNNLVVYDENGHARWASNTVGKGNKVLFQADGNLVVYNGGGQPTWASNTCCHNGNFLDVQDDGNVVIYNSSDTPLWSTHTYH